MRGLRICASAETWEIRPDDEGSHVARAPVGDFGLQLGASWSPQQPRRKSSSLRQKPSLPKIRTRTPSSSNASPPSPRFITHFLQSKGPQSPLSNTGALTQRCLCIHESHPFSCLSLAPLRQSPDPHQRLRPPEILLGGVSPSKCFHSHAYRNNERFAGDTTASDRVFKLQRSTFNY